ncbi:hypothetical protein SAMN05216316_2162 [Nitrosovibrio sp. Nv6]|nr:hypothetical protein SAMN05216316_2162 [Nitrosovibrio sp. Nv6]
MSLPHGQGLGMGGLDDGLNAGPMYLSPHEMFIPRQYSYSVSFSLILKWPTGGSVKAGYAFEDYEYPH